MATIKSFEIKRNWSKRPVGNVEIAGNIWGVKKGEEYDLVSFTLNETKKGYKWHQSLCVPCGASEKDIKKILHNVALSITDEDIASYDRFIENGEKYGWD